ALHHARSEKTDAPWRLARTRVPPPGHGPQEKTAACSDTEKRDDESWAALPKWCDTTPVVKTKAVFVPALAEQDQHLAVIAQRDKFYGLNTPALRLAKGILTKKRKQGSRKSRRALAPCLAPKHVQ